MAHKDVTLVLVNLSSEVRDVSSDIFLTFFQVVLTSASSARHVFARDPTIKALSRDEMQPAPPTIPEVLCFSPNAIDFPGPRRRELGERIIIRTTQTPHENEPTSVWSLRRFKPTASEVDRAQATCVCSADQSALGFNIPQYAAPTDP